MGRPSACQTRRVNTASTRAPHLTVTGTMDARPAYDAGGRLVPALAQIVREGPARGPCALLLSGMALRYRIVARGARQIVGLGMPGDLLDLAGAFGGFNDHHVQALTPCTVLDVPREAVLHLIGADPLVAAALWRQVLAEAAIGREWLASVGRRSAITRLTHLLCELRVRTGADLDANAGTLVLPMTQAQISDVLGLTPVHINRLLRELEARGLIRREIPVLHVDDWRRLEKAGDFCARYLHPRPTPLALLRDRLVAVLSGGEAPRCGFPAPLPAAAPPRD